MNVGRFFGRIVTAMVVAAVAGAAARAEDGDELESVRKLLADGRAEAAEERARAVLSRQADDGYAWFLLASAQHAQGRYADAAASNRKAAGHSAVIRPTALYNAACARALLEDTDAAARALEEALAAGFLDYDAMRTDPDLEILRSAGRISAPAPREYRSLTARNGVKIGYRVERPAGYEPSRTYPAAVAFAPGGQGPASCDWAIENVWGEEAARRGWIVVHLLAPEEGWMNHPAHHALEELLDEIGAEHRIENGKYHAVGYREGSRAAVTYGSMSRSYFQSVTTVGSRAFERWDDDEIADYPQKSFHFLVGGADEPGLAAARHANEHLKGDGTRVTVFEGEGVIPESTLRGGLARYLDENVRQPSS